MDTNRLDIVKSILKFLEYEINNSDLDSEQRDSLEVAFQCIESTYDLDSGDRYDLAGATDLRSLFNFTSEVSEEVNKIADEHKLQGNEFMKIGNYADALELYSKAIELNPRNHVYYCNRAAAMSRLNNHWDAIADCRESIKIKPSAKAFGRMGVAYSNMKMYKEARDAYAKAHDLDPSNDTYNQNLKLAEELLQCQRSETAAGTSSFPAANPFDFNNFINNPALLNMASQMLGDPSFRNMVSGIMSTGPDGDPNIDAFVQVGQHLAQQMQTSNPNLMDSLRQSLNTNPSGSAADAQEPQRDNSDKPNEN